MRTSKESVGLLTGSIRGLSAAMRNMGIAVTAASAISGAAMLSLSRRAERVNAAFREVDTITNTLQSSQEKYGDIVSELNTEFGLQANRVDVISGLYQSLSAGIEDTEESQREFLETAGQLATVGLVDLETSVDVLSTVLNTYNMETDEAERVSESLFRTVQLGKVTLDELAPVMGRIAALGSEMGVSIEELGASMAQLTRNGFEARIAATGLRAVIRGFMRPSDDMKDALRDIAIEQDGLVDSLTEGNDAVSNLASDYRNALSALEQFEEAQRDARREQDELSLSVQRARLAITAIEQDRIDQLDDATVAELARSNSVEELEEQIEEYQLSLNEARITESEARLEQEETEEQIQDLKQAFVEEVDAVGDLGDGIGELFLENEGLVDTLVQLNDATDDADLGMDDLFQRSRGLQAALALVGEDGENFVEILQGFEDGTLDAEEAWADLSEEVREEDFDGDIENFKELQDLDLEEEFEDMLGPQQRLRNEMSRLGEAVEEIGDIFTEHLTNQIENIVGAVDSFRERIEGMTDETQSGIARFAILATSIGLVLGPLLLLGGQIALITSALGVGLIPMLGIFGTLIGGLAIGLGNATQGGEEAESMFSRMEGILDNLIGFVRTLRDAFIQEVLPGMRIFASGVIAVFSELSSSISEETDDGKSIVFGFASALGDAFATAGEFLEENADVVGDFVEWLSDGLTNTVIPALRNFAEFIEGDVVPRIMNLADRMVEEVKPAAMEMAEGIKQVVESLLNLSQSDDVENVIDFLEEGAIKLVESITDLVEVVGQFMQENDGLIADLIFFGTVFAAIAIPALELASVLTTVIGSLKAVVIAVKTSSSIFMLLGKVVTLLGGPITVAIVLISALAAAFATNLFGIRDKTQSVINSVIGIWNTFTNAIDTVIGHVGNIASAVSQRLSPAINSFSAAGSEFISMLKTWGGWFKTVSSIMLDIFLAPFLFIIDVISTVISVFSPLIDILESLISTIFTLYIDVVLIVFSRMGDIVDSMVSYISRSINRLIHIFSLVMDTIGAVFRLFQGDFSAIEDIVDNVIAIVVTILDGFADWILTSWNILEHITGIFQDIYDFLLGDGGIIDGIVEDIKEFFLELPSSIEDVVDDMLEFFENLPERMKKEFLNKVSTFIDTLKEGGDFYEDVISALSSIISEIVSVGASIPDKIAEELTDADNINKIFDVGETIASEISDGISSVFSGIKDLIGFGLEAAKDFGKNLLESIADGIRTGEDVIQDAIEDAVGVLAAHIPSSPADEGPFSRSGTPPEESGRAIIQGMAAGIGDESIDGVMDEALQYDDPEIGVGATSSTSGGSGPGASDENGATEVTVEEGAINVGPFEGIADEDIPEKVRDEVDRSLDDVIDELRGSGRDSVERF